MITAGIDVGLEYTKAVVMKDGKVAGKACGLSGGAGRPAAVQAVYDEALKAAGVKAADVAKVVATGKGKFDVAFADDKLTEAVTAAKAAKLADAKATTVVDIGADETVVATLDGDKITEFVINEKCAAGLGLLLEGMAERFEMSIEEMSALGGPSSVAVNDGCIVFAELDALSLANQGTDVKEIGKALNEAMDSMLRKSEELSKKFLPNPQSSPQFLPVLRVVALLTISLVFLGLYRVGYSLYVDRVFPGQ